MSDCRSAVPTVVVVPGAGIVVVADVAVEVLPVAEVPTAVVALVVAVPELDELLHAAATRPMAIAVADRT